MSHVYHLPYAFDGPKLCGSIRQSNEDFSVSEKLSVAPEGEGEHIWVHLRKQGLNTEQVQRRLATHAHVKPMAVSYAGLKDRAAVTEQWFSVHLPGKGSVDWQGLNDESLCILTVTRHTRKLRRGCLLSNQFNIVVRDVQGEHHYLEQQLQQIKQHGVPNYFGEQRFGHHDGNLDAAVRLFHGDLKIRNRFKRGIYLSAARSFLFNQILANRVKSQNWNKLVQGDVMMLNNTHSVFKTDEIETAIEARVACFDVHPTGMLYGLGEGLAGHACLALEQESIRHCDSALTKLLERAKLKQERRSLRLCLPMLQWNWLAKDTLRLEFALTKGSYATMVLRELFNYHS